jgi:hypothetical protein
MNLANAARALADINEAAARRNDPGEENWEDF